MGICCGAALTSAARRAESGRLGRRWRAARAAPPNSALYSAVSMAVFSRFRRRPAADGFGAIGPFA